jgi:hypothetical protein
VRGVVALGFALLALGAGAARGGGPAAPLPLPCGLPQEQPLWVDYADGSVPFWSTIFARPGIVAAASNFVVPPQLRAAGANTVYFDLYLNNRVGTPTTPVDPSTIQARADKLFATAVKSSACNNPLIAENELFGAQLPTPWTTTTAQYRANVLAYLQRLNEDGARPFLLLSQRPWTHDEAADEWWRSVAQVADIVPEVYFNGPTLSDQGAVLASRQLRNTLRTRIEDLIQIGVPTNRIGVMLTFSSTPGAGGGRQGLQPLSKWLDVVKWEALAAKQVSSELSIASIWSWGWATFNPAGNDPDKPKVACAWLWTRDHSLCDAPALDGSDFDTSLDVGATPPPGAICVLGSSRLEANDVAALSRVTGDRDLAFSADYQHVVLAQAKTVDAAAILQAERDVILDHFRGSRSAYVAALARAHASRTVARIVLADELRRHAVEAGLRVAQPTATQVSAWYDTFASVNARAVRASKRVAWLGGKAGVAIAQHAPGRLFALPVGARVTIDGVKLTVLGETAPLAAFPLQQAAASIRLALLAEAKDAAFAIWIRTRENQSLNSLTCRHDQLPQPAAISLTDWLPYLAVA